MYHNSQIYQSYTSEIINNESDCLINETVNYDTTIHLNEQLKHCWKKILASISTTESLEETIISKLIISYKNDLIKTRYLISHKNDENLHTKKLINYNFQTFGYKKIKKTLSDIIIYDLFLKNFSIFFIKKPIYALSLLLFFEIYGAQFYRIMSETSKNNNLINLSKIIDKITKDEERHIAGIKKLIKSEIKYKKLSNIDKILIILIINICIFDLNMNKFSFHNKEVRNNVIQIGMNPNELTKNAKNIGKKIINELVNQKEFKNV